MACSFVTSARVQLLFGGYADAVTNLHSCVGKVAALLRKVQCPGQTVTAKHAVSV